MTFSVFCLSTNSSQVLFSVSQKLVTHQIVNSTEVLQWLGEVLSLRNRFLNKFKDHATVDANIPRTRDAQNKLEVSSMLHEDFGGFVFVWIVVYCVHFQFLNQAKAYSHGDPLIQLVYNYLRTL